MSLGDFLIHRVSIERTTDTASIDEYGQPVRTTATLASDVAASIQPKGAREMAAVHEAGATLADHTIYLFPQDLTTGDAIIHDPDVCPLTVDLPLGRYEVTAVPLAAGVPHHLEVSAKLLGSPLSAIAPAVGS